MPEGVLASLIFTAGHTGEENMANNEASESLPAPKLTVPRAEAAQKIKDRIEEGYDIRNLAIQSDKDLKRARSELTKWHVYNKALLAKLFDNPSLVEEYQNIGVVGLFIWDSPTFKEMVQSFQQEMDGYITRLEAILGKLGLIDEQSETLASQDSSEQNLSTSREIFVVHGHDEAAREAVARVLERLGLKPIILLEKPNAGLITIIEKLEQHAANVDFAVVLLTPDDFGGPKEKLDEQKLQARENVIFEFGYFTGKLGRKKVYALYKEGVYFPSDVRGIWFEPMDAGGAWKYKLAQEINQAGIKVDSNALLAD